MALIVIAALVLLGCGSAATPPRGSGQIPAAVAAGVRPIGRGERFQPPLRHEAVPTCRRALGGRFGAHVELFAADRVMLVAAGIGVRPPLEFLGGRIVKAGCYGDLVTLEPTGLVLVREGARRTVGDLFQAWGQPLSARRLASFASSPGRVVEAYVGGRRRHGPPEQIPLQRHAEIVLEVGPHVPPHGTYTFPLGL